MMDASLPVTPPASARRSEITTRSLSAVAGAAIGMLVGPTAIIAPPIGLFMPAVSLEFGLDRTGFPLIMLMVSLCAGVASPLAGRMIDRFGVRRVILPAVFLFALAEAGLAVTQGSFPAFLVGMALVGILAGIQNPTAYTKVLAEWFQTRRGLMVAIACAVGGGGGGILVPQIAERLIVAGGWRLGYAGLGLFIVVGLPFLFVLLREPKRLSDKAPFTAAAAVESVPSHGRSRREAMGSPAFWMILVSLVCVSCSLVALSVHVPAWIADAGGSTARAAGFLSLFAAGSVVGQLSSGLLLDRVNSPKIGAIFFGLAFLGAFLLRSASPGSDMILLYAFMIGTGLGAELGMACYFISRYFGLKAYGEIYGVVYGTLVVAAGLGPVLMGVAFGLSHGYGPAFSVAAGALFVAMTLILLLPPYVFAVSRDPSEI